MKQDICKGTACHALTEHHRRSIRLEDYDYSSAGAYFITICAYNRECVFGKIMNRVMALNEFGEIAQLCWQAIPQHFPYVELDEFAVMPNHIHGIINIAGARHAVPLQEQFGHPTIGTIPTIIRSFKSVVTNQINQIRNTPRVPVWQRNYYEHIIRNEESLNRIREYIQNNPLKWKLDEYNPDKSLTG